LLADQIGRQCRQSFVLTFSPTVFDRNILAFDIAGLLQALAERRDLLTQRSRRCNVQKTNHRQRPLLCIHGKRPRYCGSPE
jgi:hypothetical protein